MEPGPAGLAEGVLAAARRWPAAAAVTDGARARSYRELAAVSGRVARRLRGHGVRPGDAVAVQLPRSWRLIAVMLGIRRMGATVVPLDAQSPPGRRQHVLADSGSVALVGDGRAASPAAGVRQLAVADLIGQAGDPGRAEAPDDPVGGAPVSFLFYTSGTTGQPKGVEVRDAGLMRLARPGYIRLAAGARYACLSNPAFDALSFEVWTPLLTGGCCVILDDDTVATPHLLAEALQRERVDTMFVTTALFNAVTEAVPGCFTSAGQVLVGGEPLNARIVRRWYARNPASATRLYNAYGPTEATTFTLVYPIPRDFDGDAVPIGRPLPGTEVLPVADGTRLAGPGEVAELYIGGQGVAAGYRNLPAETARCFVRLPWHDGGRRRYYRSGDLVRQQAGGPIEYVGRADRQIKIRGFRIEPGEVERQLVTHPAIRQAHVCSRRGPSGDRHELLAYLVADDSLSYASLERHLAATLPPWMRPHRLYRVEMLPRTANGKVDGDALLARDDKPWPPGDAGPQATPWQREVLGLVGEVLGEPRPQLSPGDTFIAAGGDSLAALRLRFAVRERWGRDLPQDVVLRSDLAGLADAIAAGGTAAGSPYPEPAAPAGARSAPATSEQQRLWLLQQQGPASAYNTGFAFRLDGPVDEDALRAAVRGLVDRHPALRTAFHATSGGLRQTVGEPYDPWIEAGDSGDWETFARRLFATPFDLSQPRLLQACWRPDRDGGMLLLHMHHIAVDGWSLSVLLRELSARYAGRAVPGGAPTPLDYAAWQAAWSSRPQYRRLRAALRDHYAVADESVEPLRPREPARTDGPPAEGGGRLLVSRIDGARRAALGRLSARQGLTRFELLLGAFSWSMYGVTGRTRPRVASPVVGRPVQAFGASVGMFANTVLLPLRVAPAERLWSQLRRQAADVRAVLDRQDVTLADAVGDHDFRTGGPLFDFMFVMDNTDFGALRLPGCDAAPAWLAPAAAKCPLTLSVTERGDGFDCLWEYDAGYLDAADVEAMAGLFQQGLDGLAAEPDPVLRDLIAPHREALPDHGRAAARPLAYTTIAGGFARQVRRTPSATALADGDAAVSYAQLDVHAAALAAELAARFPLPAGDQPCHMALRLDPSVEHVVALLALARLNITAVPLDPACPPALLRQILDQVRPACVLVSSGESGGTGADGGGPPRHPVVLSTAPPAGRPRRRPGGQRPLYTLFTSGSTGTPKGVQVPDRTLCNLLQWQATEGGLPPGAVTQQFSMLCFDVSFQEIFGTLCGGGTLHLIRPGWQQDMPALLHQLAAAGIERIHMPYVALQLLAEHGRRLDRYPPSLREVITAGEQLLCTGAVRDWFSGLRGARLFNHYGPAETHVVSALCLDGDPAGWPDRPAIGRPVAGAWLRVTDDAGLPAPPDCPGDLLIGGLPAVPCYLGDPGLNAARFTTWSGAGRFYRSGDRARFDRQGLLHYLGRHDEQVKVSGHRLELGQVEAALASHPAVVVAAVVLDAGQLVACAEFKGDPPAPDELDAHLAARLPAYVRVGRFRRLAALPRTASGKLDRRRMLAAPGEDLRPRPAAAAALTPREAQLTALFEAVIGRPIAPGQRFFDAGASSLGLMRFHLRATIELGLPLSIPDLFEHVTVRDLARFLDGEPGGAPAHHPPGGRAGDGEPIAITGLAVRLPGAGDLAGFWAMVAAGGSGITYFDAADGLVGARSQMPGLLAFDPGHFGIGRQEARLMDPQQRHLLMACVHALAHAGLADPAARRTGIVASCGENTYFQAMLRESDSAMLPDAFQLALHHDKDFLATKAAYHLGLTGPAFTVQAACSSSLVAVHLAAGLLRQGDAEMMLAAGVLVDTLLASGYRYRPQHIFAKDGHCRPFSDDATGTVGASGVAVVVLKPLSLARRDGDTVYALLTGSAVNNDGAAKLSYTAPGLAGQREAVSTALRRSGRTAADLGYVEAHGTGTELGDPVEVSALRQAYGLPPGAGGIALSSVKSQIGHLGAAAGVAGLVRAALAVYHDRIPPNIGFRRLNPQIGADAAPFYVPVRSQPWPAGRPRVAAVSSFGIGGTNAHVLIEADELAVTPGQPGAGPDEPAEPSGEAAASPGGSAALREAPESLPGGPAILPARLGAGPGRRAAGAPVPCLVLSAASPAALRADAARIAEYLSARPESYPHVLRHLQAGRPARRYRAAAACPDASAAVSWLRTAVPAVVTPTGEEHTADGAEAADLVKAWLTGAAIRWPAGSAQPPWDFPPPAFALADYDFPRAAPGSTRAAPDGSVAVGSGVRTGSALGGPATAGLSGLVAAAPDGPVDAGEGWPPRRSEADWMYQPQWVRLRRATPPGGARAAGVLLVMTAGQIDPAVLRPFEAGYARVVRAWAGASFARVADDAYQLDPADPSALQRLLDDMTGLADWLHALPLAVDGQAGADALARSRWAALDTPAALLQAVGGRQGLPAPRIWWLSHQAQPAAGPVARPELGLLAGAAEVGPQECAVDGHWLDLPGPDPAAWAVPVAGLLEASGVPGESALLPRRLALRQGYWWRQVPLPVAAPVANARAAAGPAPFVGPALPARAAPGPAADPRVHLILGGTGGIGATIAAWLLEQSGDRVVLVGRRPYLPPGLTRWADRVDLIQADLAAEPTELAAGRIVRAVGRLDGLVHAAGVAAGGVIVRRDPAAAVAATAAKLNGALLIEHLIGRCRPAYALYCSSMSAQLGGVGQFDYAAACGALDGFARYQASDDETTLRLSIDWDVWREAGMAAGALKDNARHQAHLAVGLTVAEARRVLDQAMRLQLPQVLVSTTDIDRSSVFYAPAPTGLGTAEPRTAEPVPAPAAPVTASTTVIAPAPAVTSAAASAPASAGPSAASTAEHLAGCLRRWLGLDDLDPAACLYDLGADSLILLDLVAEIKERTEADLSLSQLSQQVSLVEVLALLGESDATPAAAAGPVAVDVWRECAGPAVLCLIHPVGGDLLAYRPLLSALDGRLTVCLIADPALPQPGTAEPLAWPIAERARRYHAALASRFPPGEWRWRLAGWSFGAWMAVAVAAEAEATGQPADEIYLLDPPPPDAGSRLAAYDDAQLEAVFARELAHGDLARADGAADSGAARAYAARLARCGRANLASMASYTPPVLAVTPARLWLASRPMAGLPPPGPPDAAARRWRAHLPGLAGWQALDVTHDGIVRSPHVQAVADAISAASLPVLAPVTGRIQPT